MEQSVAALPSNKKFGYFLSAVFSAIFVYYFVQGSISFYLALAGLALVTFITTLVAADKLLVFNKLWLKLGILLGKIISPIVLELIFFVLISPIALIMRLSGRDELRLKMQRRASHWKERLPAGPESQSFKNQF